MSEMTEKQKETFDKMTNMVASFFGAVDAVDTVAIKGALRLAMKEWEDSAKVSVVEAEKWPFDRYLNECCIPALRLFVDRLIKQGYDRALAEKQLSKLIDFVKQQYGKA